jgi:Glyoxalase-like domain
MAHYSRLMKIVIDVPPAEHDRELAFWEDALGQQLPQFDHPEYRGAALHGQDFWLLVQRLDGGAPRVHLDVHTDNLEAEVSRLERLGASRVQHVHGWWVMRDPAGLPFCVLREQEPGALHGGNAQRWE